MLPHHQPEAWTTLHCETWASHSTCLNLTLLILWMGMGMGLAEARVRDACAL